VTDKAEPLRIVKQVWCRLRYGGHDWNDRWWTWSVCPRCGAQRRGYRPPKPVAKVTKIIETEDGLEIEAAPTSSENAVEMRRWGWAALEEADHRTAERPSERKYEHLTDAELARDVYLAIIAHDDDLPDSVTDLFWEAQHMASVLWGRLRGPYCEVEGCGQPHTEHFPWCSDHLRAASENREAGRGFQP
jgi:hypothetical protein